MAGPTQLTTLTSSNNSGAILQENILGNLTTLLDQKME